MDSESSKPTNVGSNDQLGLDPERAEFERWCSQDGRWPQALERSGTGYRLMSTHAAWATWQPAWEAAVAAERERLAQVVRDFPHWLGAQAKRELLAAMGIEA